ncbi:MAG TPA: hypothetical protein ENK01_02080, partial [Hellea balneolensis]|nr:hypothetical protein [Hellea balneolensis]
MKRILALIVILLFCAQTARADVLLSEDFQSGKTTGWKGNPGKGDIRLSRYKSNISLRLQGNAYAVRKVALKDSGRVLVQAAFAAQNLGPGEACLLEVSTAPQKWKALGRVQDGQDDGLSLHKVGGIIQTKTGQSLLVRLRVAGKRKTTTCWADNIRIVHLAKTRDLPEHIPFAAFFANKKLKSPYAGQAFAPSAQAQKPVQPLSGSLELSAPVRADKFEILKDEFGYDILSGKFRLLPTFRIGLVSDGETLIPVTRGPMQNTHPDREWLFEPGKIWREPGDEGWMRAALPFAFQERNANCIHNGLMSFLYRDGQISNAIVQIGSETCAYLKYNMWSRLHLDFRNVPPETAETVRKNYRKELSNRLPRRPIEELGSPELVAQIGSELEVNPENMTTYGYVKDKQLFASPCPTRFGAYPYCADLPLPSYSMAKSMVAAIG